MALSGTLWLSVTRWRHADRETRRALGPTLWAALATLFAFGTLLASGLTGPDPFEDVVYLVALFPLASVPYAFLYGLLRSKLSAAEQVAEENVRLDAELRARYDELRASRARIVSAADDARRKLERDLHDGAQQRLVGSRSRCGSPATGSSGPGAGGCAPRRGSAELAWQPTSSASSRAASTPRSSPTAASTRR